MSQLITLCLKYMNYSAILVGFTRLRIDYSNQRIIESKFTSYYVIILNIVTVVLLPAAHVISIKYITVNFNNNLLVFTDLANLFINYAVVVFSVVSRWRRECLYKELSQEIFKLDLYYFNKLSENLQIEKRANMVIFIKMCTVSLDALVPIFGVLNQAKHVDVFVFMLAMYSSLIGTILHAVLFLFFYMLWHVRRRIWRLNARLIELFHDLQKLQRNARDMLAPKSRTLQQLSGLAAEELREISGVHARLTVMLLRLNRVYRWQVIAVLLTYLITNISYGYYFILSLLAPSNSAQSQTASSIVVSIAASFIVFVDINLLYWTADDTTRACQYTPQILRHFEVLTLMSTSFERECEKFALQLKQQKMDINIAGMFLLNRQTSLALWAFCVRHILLLVQFDYEARKRTSGSSGVLEHINHILQFGEDERVE
ncbi:putative gustatory receptor 36b [Ceratitis capitata]|uniref:putative gustatory receptor 36b n=1 Tax=Ceratitis capitata TaxID=7213 RepID=UPI0003296DD2|nr:putative gustatory receptor 36b [Ceratitis capitata]